MLIIRTKKHFSIFMWTSMEKISYYLSNYKCDNKLHYNKPHILFGCLSLSQGELDDNTFDMVIIGANICTLSNLIDFNYADNFANIYHIIYLHFKIIIWIIALVLGQPDIWDWCLWKHRHDVYLFYIWTIFSKLKNVF